MSHSGHDSTSSSSTTTGMMHTSFHLSRGDTLWFAGWVPQSTGALAGAAIGLFLLAIVERWLAAMRVVMEAWWQQRAEAIVARRFAPLPDHPPSTEKVESGDSSLESAGLPAHPVHVPSLVPRAVSVRAAAPFVFSHDLSRGVLHAMQTALQYGLMLSIMTFQGAYFIAVVAGAGLGEFLFGRYGRGATMH